MMKKMLCWIFAIYAPCVLAQPTSFSFDISNLSALGPIDRFVFSYGGYSEYAPDRRLFVQNTIDLLTKKEVTLTTELPIALLESSFTANFANNDQADNIEAQIHYGAVPPNKPICSLKNVTYSGKYKVILNAEPRYWSINGQPKEQIGYWIGCDIVKVA